MLDSRQTDLFNLILITRGEFVLKPFNALIVTAVIAISSIAIAKPTLSTKIVGGENALKGEIPYIVSLRSKSYGHFCGGSLIAQNWILTAAHCVRGGTIDEVWIGMLDQKDTAGVEKIKPAKIIAHEKYNSQTMENDFALIKLSQNSTFATVALNSLEISIDDSMDATPIMSMTAGWGATKESSYTLPNMLQKVSVPLVSTNNCNATEAYAGDIKDSMICAGYKAGGKDSCQGDSGGPLVVANEDGTHTLIGVVSWGEGCARANKYGVYSKVSNGYEWIQTKINASSE